MNKVTQWGHLQRSCFRWQVLHLVLHRCGNSCFSETIHVGFPSEASSQNELRWFIKIRDVILTGERERSDAEGERDREEDGGRERDVEKQEAVRLWARLKISANRETEQEERQKGGSEDPLRKTLWSNAAYHWLHIVELGWLKMFWGRGRFNYHQLHVFI